MLDLVKRTNDYIIYLNDQPLLTPEGRVMAHPRSRLLKHILTDMLLVEEGGQVLSYTLLAFEFDHLQTGKDPVKASFEQLLHQDPFVRIKTGAKSSRTDTGYVLTEQQINLSFWISSELVSVINLFYTERLKQMPLGEHVEAPFSAVIREVYRNLPDAGKSAVNLLVKEHQPGIVLPLLLVLNWISPAEYTKGVISLTERHPGRMNHHDMLSEATAIRDYLLAALPGETSGETVDEIIGKGESDTLEFKSTLRWDVRAMKTNPSIERASLKTISAFLNSDGGKLVIGVRDDGSTEGIETDALQTDDRWMLHLWNLIHGSLGKEVSKYIHSRLEKRGDKTICLVDCLASPRPVFLRQKGFPEEFFVRMGPATTALSVSEALIYIADHFQASVVTSQQTDQKDPPMDQ